MKINLSNQKKSKVTREAVLRFIHDGNMYFHVLDLENGDKILNPTVLGSNNIEKFESLVGNYFIPIESLIFNGIPPNFYFVKGIDFKKVWRDNQPPLIGNRHTLPS